MILKFQQKEFTVCHYSPRKRINNVIFFRKARIKQNSIDSSEMFKLINFCRIELNAKIIFSEMKNNYIDVTYIGLEPVPHTLKEYI